MNLNSENSNVTECSLSESLTLSEQIETEKNNFKMIIKLIDKLNIDGLN